MYTLIRLFGMFLFFAFSLVAIGQKSKGKIIYEEITSGLSEKVKTNLKNSISDPSVLASTLRQLDTERIVQKALFFNENASSYVSLEEANSQYNNIADGDVLYKDLARKSSLKQINFLSKRFLISGHVTEIKWKLMNETKQIGDFDASLAKASIDGHSIEAWFTYDIPVQAGPSIYGGLPGMILEVIENEQHKIVFKNFDVSDVKTISPPSRGEPITQDDFDVLKIRKLEELSSSDGVKVMTIKKN